ncbi:MAG: TatD family hydrolase [Candidatus Thorarchaeota archaeon]
MKSDLLLIDTHCHIESVEFDLDREEVINNAQKAGISIITSAIEKNLWEKACKIADMHSNVFASVGLDPTQFTDCDLALEWIKSNKQRMVALGEVGLDHYLVRDHRQRDFQETCFKRFIDLARELGMPVQVHSRSAGRKAIEILEKQGAADVHLHAFDGKAGLAKSASRNLGYYFSIPTSVVRSPQKRKLVKAVDIERLLLETDSPVLGVEKTQRNVPANLPIALREVAIILNRDEDELRQIVLENSLRLYNKIGSI